MRLPGHISLHDPWGLGHLMATQGRRPVVMPVVPPAQTVYMSPQVRQLAQFILHHHMTNIGRP